MPTFHFEHDPSEGKWKFDPSESDVDPSGQDDEIQPAFSEDGIDYFCEEEITVPRSETPDFIYEIIPHIDEISHTKISVKEHSEQLWLNEFNEGELTIAFFIPVSWKKSNKQFGSGLKNDRETLEKIAKGLNTLCQGQSGRSSIYTETDSSRNLNHLLNGTQ